MGTSPGLPGPLPPRDPRDDNGPRKPKKPRPRPTGPAINPEARKRADRALEALKAKLLERVE
jgi:hypothetical protein